MDPITLLTAVAPLAVDLGKSLINRFVAGDQFKPANIDEYTKMQSIDLERFKAVSEAGGNGASYPWVEALVRLQRPIIGLTVLAVWAWAHVNATAISPDFTAVDNAAGAVWFYLFGERTLAYARSKTTTK